MYIKSWILVLFIACADCVAGIYPTLKTVPKQIALRGDDRTTRLRITCIQPEYKNIFKLVVGKMVSRGVSQDLVRVSLSDQAPVFEDESIRGRSSTKGQVTMLGGHIQLELYQLQCRDAAVYYCVTILRGEDKRLLDTENVTVRADPEIPFMRVTPFGSRFHVGLDIRLKCSGRVGSHPSPGIQIWVWEWRTSGKTATWEIYPYSKNITHVEPSPAPTSTCEFESSSTLTLKVTEADQGRVIRCSVFGEPRYNDQMTIHLDEDGSRYTTPIIVLAGVIIRMGVVVVVLVLVAITVRSLSKPPTQVIIIPEQIDASRMEYIINTDQTGCNGHSVAYTEQEFSISGSKA